MIVLPLFRRPIYKFLATLCADFSKKINRFPAIFRLIMWIVIPALLFFLLRSNSYIPGDGHLILSHVVSGERISSTAIGFSILVKALSGLLDVTTPAEAAWMIASISILSGIVYLFFLSNILRLVIPHNSQRPLLFLCGAACGLTVLFTGYVETYPIVIAWLAVYINYAVRFIQGKSGVMTLVPLFVIGMFWHIWFIAFLPSLFFA